MGINGLQLTGASGGLFATLAIALTFLLHIVFAIGVYKFAKSGEVDGRRTWFVGPMFWALCTLFLGPFFSGVYWVIHHSTLGGFSDHALNELRERKSKFKNES